MEEIKDERQLNLKTYDTGQTEVYSSNVHYLDTTTNEYKEIDNSIYDASSESNYDYETRYNEFTVDFKKDLSAVDSVRFIKGTGAEGQISITINGLYLYDSSIDKRVLIEPPKNTTAIVHGDTITYNEVFTGVQFKYTILNGGLKEEITLSEEVRTVIPDIISLGLNPETTQYIFSVSLHSRHGIDLVDNVLNIKGDDGSYNSWIDSIVSLSARNQEVQSFSQFNDNEDEYLFGVSYKSIYQAQMPIIIDPTIISTVSMNGQENDATIGGSYSTNAQLSVYNYYYDDGKTITYYYANSVLQFDVSSLQNQTISSANLQLYKTNGLASSVFDIYNISNYTSLSSVPTVTGSSLGTYSSGGTTGYFDTGINLRASINSVKSSGKASFGLQAQVSGASDYELYFDNNTNPPKLVVTSYSSFVQNTPTASGTTVTVTWTGSGGLIFGDKFTVYYASGSGLTAAQVIAANTFVENTTYNGTSATFTGTSGTTYSVVVVEQQSNGVGGFYAGAQSNVTSIAVSGSGGGTVQSGTLTIASASSGVSSSSVAIHLGTLTASSTSSISNANAVRIQGGSITSSSTGSISNANAMRIQSGSTTSSSTGSLINSNSIRIQSSSATSSSIGSMSSYGTGTSSLSAIISGTGGVTISAVRIQPASITSSSTGTITTTAIRIQPGTTVSSSTGTVSATGTNISAGASATFGSSGSISTSSVAIRQASTTMQSTGSAGFSASSGSTYSGQVSMSSVGNMSIAPPIRITSSAVTIISMAELDTGIIDGTIVARAQLTLTDLNDAIITGAPPDSPQNGLLWIDTSVTPNVLKKWIASVADTGVSSGGYWEVQSLSLDTLDPGAAQGISDAITSLSDMASDSRISQQERVTVQSDLSTITGINITSSTTVLPTIAQMDASQAGEVYNVRLEATNAGLDSTNANYKAVQDYYNALKTYLESVFPLPWDTDSTDSSIIFADDWMTAWTNYYESIYALKAGIADKQAQNAANAGQDAKDYSDLTKQYSVRYIRDWLNGSTANDTNRWVEIKVMSGTTNRATGATLSASPAWTDNTKPITRIIDGDLTSASYANGGTGQQYIQIDLLSVYQDINYIQVWHYFADGRTCHGTKTEVSDNGQDWTTLFDSSVTGEYAEISTGRTTLVNGANAVTQAQSSADAANLLLKDIADDNKLTPTEKQDVLKEWNIIASEKSTVDAQADIFSVDRSTYDTAFQTLANYLNGGTTWTVGDPLWLSGTNMPGSNPVVTYLNGTTDIVGTTFRANFKAYYDARTLLVKNVAAGGKSYSEILATIMNIDNTKTTYFPFDENLCATNGLNPNSGYVATLRNTSGKFSGAIAIEPDSKNVCLADAQNGTSPWTGDGSPTLSAVDTTTFRGKRVVKFHPGTGTNCYITNISTSTPSTFWTFRMYVKRVDGQPVTGINTYMNITNNTNVNQAADSIRLVEDGWYEIIRTRTGLVSGYPTLFGLYNLASTDYYIAEWQIEPRDYPTSYIPVNTSRSVGKLYYPKELINPSAFTISCWFNIPWMHRGDGSNPPVTGINGNWYHPIIEIATPTNSTQSFGIAAGPQPNPYNRYLVLQAPGSTTSTYAIQDNTWYHLVATYDGAAYKVYINGTQQISYASTTAIAPATNEVLMIGGGYRGRPFIMIDELRIDSRAMLVSEIQAIYSSQSPFVDAIPRVSVPVPSGVTMTLT